jgi:hypothetical protein
MIPEGTSPTEIVIVVVVLTIIAAILLVLLFRWTRPRDEIMASAGAAPPADPPAQVVHVPVAATGTEASGTAPPDRDSPDTTAAEGGFEMPRLSRHNRDRERIIYLATQLKPDGKHRFSANEICTLMKGNPRADVLKLVRELREPKPEYRPLTHGQQELRESLSLE